jgi:hypothetical protein
MAPTNNQKNGGTCSEPPDSPGTATTAGHLEHKKRKKRKKECDTSAPMKDHTRLLLQYCAEASGGLDDGEAIRQQHAVDVADSLPPLALTLTLGRHWR